MKIFPSKELKFKLLDSKFETMERLKRRTEYTKNMTSSFTDKSFRGIVQANEFRIISSEIGKGAFCVLDGKIENEEGFVNLYINKAFKILFSLIFILPFLGIVFQTINNPNDFLIFILVALMQILMIRYFFIGFLFTRMSKHSMNRLRDVLDIEFIK